MRRVEVRDQSFNRDGVGTLFLTKENIQEAMDKGEHVCAGVLFPEGSDEFYPFTSEQFMAVTTAPTAAEAIAATQT